MLSMITVIKIINLKENSFPSAERMAAFPSDRGIAPSKTPWGQIYLQKNGSPIPIEFVTTTGRSITKTKRKHFIQTLDIEEINEGMYVYIGDKKYEIIDIEDEANLSLSYILTLEES